MSQKPKIFEALEKLSTLTPTAFYWTDLNCVIVGVNKYGLNIVGDISYNDIVGKSPYDMYPPETAKHIYDNTKKVIETRQAYAFEESVRDLVTGKTRYYIANRSPLFENGSIVGTVGAVTEITAQKELEQLLLENQRHQVEAEQQYQFRRIVNQMVHDIGTPIATLNMLLTQDITEEVRVNMRDALCRIVGITNEVLNLYNEKAVTDKKQTESIAVSSVLMQLISERKQQYKNILFSYNAPRDTHFVFIRVELIALQRAVSNIINNAVDAFDKQSGNIIVKLVVKDSTVSIVIEDNGKGMPKDIADKILNNIAITDGKKDGHGIGMGQVRDMLKNSHGTLGVESTPGSGTSITLTFPKEPIPHWIANKLELFTDDTVIILDDDHSIHGAWEQRFASEAPQIPLQHFTDG